MVECKYNVKDYIILEDENGIFLDQITEINFSTVIYKFDQLYVILRKTDEVCEGFVGDCDQNIYTYEKNSRLATKIEILLYS
jgi:hypothetical protein